MATPKIPSEAGHKVLVTCPNCSRPLSSWEQVLLSVDRALICKGCWYHILLDIYESHADTKEEGPETSRIRKGK